MSFLYLEIFPFCSLPQGINKSSHSTQCLSLRNAQTTLYWLTTMCISSPATKLWALWRQSLSYSLYLQPLIQCSTYTKHANLLSSWAELTSTAVYILTFSSTTALVQTTISLLILQHLLVHHLDPQPVLLHSILHFSPKISSWRKNTKWVYHFLCRPFRG